MGNPPGWQKIKSAFAASGCQLGGKNLLALAAAVGNPKAQPHPAAFGEVEARKAGSATAGDGAGDGADPGAALLEPAPLTSR